MKYRDWYRIHGAALTGRVAVVTGGNSGVGFEAARGLLSLGAEVVLACRSATRALAARERLLTEFPTGTVRVVLLDLASRAAIAEFAAEIAQRYEKIDIFIHSAGVYYPRGTQTEDGLPMTVGVNYHGTVRVAEAVLPLMDGTGRMVFTTSLVDRFGRDRAVRGEGYAAYAKSKHLLSAYVLSRATARREGEPAFIAVHPGITATDLLSPEKTTHKPLFSRLGHAFLYFFTHSPEKAALTDLLAATAGENGDVIGPRGLLGISGYPHKTRFCRAVRKTAEK